MRILHVAASYLPAMRYGGTIVSVHGLCRALAARGHDVHVCTTNVDGPEDSPVPLATPVDMHGVRVWYFPSTRLRRIYWAPQLDRHLRTAIAGFDVVHTHAIYLWPLWAAARRAHAAGIPHVLSLRGMLEKALIDQKNPLLKAALIGFIEKRRIEAASAIHVTSRREAEEARAFGFNLPPVCEIPNGVDAFDLGDGAVDAEIRAVLSNGPFVLYLGRINWKKGLDRLLRALPHAPGVRVILAGNDEEGYRTSLEALARELGVADRVVFTGQVHGANKAALLSGAQVLVLPSYSENFGNVVLEAMAAGRPVIVTPEVGVADLVREGGAGLVSDGDASALGSALASLASNPAARAELGARGRRLAEQQFTWDAVAAKMEQLYGSIIPPTSA